MTQQELADECDVNRVTVWRWENERGLPADRLQQVADILGVSPEELLDEKERREETYVTSKDDLSDWQMSVSASGLTGPVVVLLSALPMFMDMDQWFVSVTPEAMSERAQRDLETIEAHWDEMLETEFVDRVGPAEYVLRLTFPDEE
jgi:transcriptional regulator with XRE-family HTH domain